MDWACQWCAYPLISTSYNKIPKTFSELQAERQLAFFLLPEPEPEAEAEQVPEPAPEPALIELSVEELYASLGGGITATDARYRNKSLKVTGLVYRKIINENLDVAYVIMTSTKNYGEWQVTCTFDKEYENEIRRLMERDAVTVQGKYDGYGATFLLRDCTLVR
jgi:hypothetical protein